ncbi:MAG: DUF924 family protein [Paracoccaceae bacterium]|jgi:uncharacterized protein (DUF924 family)
MPVQSDVLRFWLEEVGPEGWYVADPEIDGAITARFGTLWEELRGGAHEIWGESAEGALAYLIAADQFPRNMFRGRPEAFATDDLARQMARRAVVAGQDLTVKEPERVFFYMPFEHSESLADQDWSVALLEARIGPLSNYALHARAHREVIRRFGRFPFRNVALSRGSTPEEEVFLTQGGYGAIVRELGG